VEQAGGDERDFQAKGAQEVPSPVSKEYDRHLIGLLRKGEALPGHQEEAADEIERLRDWNDHLNNTVLPNILNPNFLMLMKGGERLLDLCTKDGKFIGVSLNDMKDVFDWMVTHARIAPDQAALAQPSPAQAEAEQPEIVAFRYRCTNAEGEPLPGWFYSDGAGTLGLREPLMAVSQHERIIGAMRAVVTQLRQHKSDYMDAGQETYWALQNEIREREAEIARLDGLVSSRTVERDAAQAEVERLRQGMKGDYDIDAWLEWTKERDTALARVAELESKLADTQPYKQHPQIVGYARKKELAPLLDPTQPDGSHIYIGLDHPACWAEEPPYEFLTPLYTGPVAQNSVPDGYALVPVEPTREMFIAVNKEDDKAYAGGCDHGAQFDWLWDAALEAAPRLNGRAVSEGLLRSACSSITRLILSAQTRPSCQKGMVDPCRCHRCNVDRALKVDAELRSLLDEGKENGHA
ncbi:hypothetical protein QVM33_34195, partial [Pseudomonas aeruginosa]